MKSESTVMFQKSALLMLTFSLMLVVSCQKDSTHTVTSSEPDPVPVDSTILGFSIVTVDSTTLDMRSLAGKVVVINLWDTWCGPCTREIPHLDSLQTTYRDSGLVVVGIALAQNGRSEVAQYVTEHSMNYIVGYWVEEQMPRQIPRPSGIPTTYVMGRDCTVESTTVGYHDYAYWQGQIRPLL
jgi:thiol-disulfide isomerase/thioredoxin